MTSYPIVLVCHSYLRWVVLALLAVVAVRAARAAAQPRAWNAGDEQLHRALLAAADLQLALGVLLYFVASPLAAAFFATPKLGMRDPTLRFFGVEHATAMLLGIAALHGGRVLSKRAGGDGAARQRRVFRWTTAALVCIVIGVPWPFLKYGRPLFRPLVEAPDRP